MRITFSLKCKVSNRTLSNPRTSRYHLGDVTVLVTSRVSLFEHFLLQHTNRQQTEKVWSAVNSGHKNSQQNIKSFQKILMICESFCEFVFSVAAYGFFTKN